MNKVWFGSLLADWVEIIKPQNTGIVGKYRLATSTNNHGIFHITCHQQVIEPPK